MSNEHTDNPDEQEDGRGEYPDATYLYIRTNPADDGSEPVPSSLAVWKSPDIVVVQPDGTRGSEAVANAVNHVEVTVTNSGGIIANDALIDVFVGDPSTVMTPATVALIGADYLTVPPINTSTISFPWVPGSGDAGHRCLLARVSLIIPPDTYVDGTRFDVRGDRHIAQRNIHVLAMMASQRTISFAFAIANPFEQAGVFDLRATEIRDRRLAEATLRAAQCGFTPRLAGGELPEISLDLEQEIIRPTLGPVSRQKAGPIRRPRLRGSVSSHRTRLEGGATGRAVLTVARSSDANAGEVSILDVEQVEIDTQRAIGGLSLVIQYS